MPSHHGGQGFKTGYSHVGFVVDKVALGQVFSEYFAVSPANLYSNNFSTITITYHPGLVQ
jgi:predicted alpha/beta superfamily hydrolase